MNMTGADLAFSKDVGEPQLALGWIRAALQDPDAMLRAGDLLWSSAQEDNSSSLWVTASALLEMGETPQGVKAAANARDTWEGLPVELASALAPFMDAARRANALIEHAFSELSAEDRSYLAAVAFAGVFNAEDEPATREVMEKAGIRPQDIATVIAEGKELDATPSAKRLLSLLEKVRRSEALEAGHIFQSAVFQLADRVKAITNWPSGNVVLVTDLGKVRITGGGDDSYSDRALLIMSPSGRNTYHGEAGVANGLKGQRLAAIIDLDGNDTYRSSGLLSPGSALFGVSVVVDENGSDIWRSSYAGQGFGCFGTGWVEDYAGDDDYEARGYAQAASFFGMGVLRDFSGNDVYDVGQQGQACAVLPGFAALIDRAGNDRYFAGGRDPDYERNDDRFLSLAQGFAIGLRPFAGGGVAMLADLSGNDTYVADVYGQAVSYYYSAAFLFDGAGHDHYTVHHYGQGAGIHLSLGLLADFGGDDSYQGGVLVQGAAHDFAVGGLLDRSGRDTYVADHDAQGHGMNNAMGWLLDGAGDDVYSARDVSNSQGVGNSGGERECGSLGVLLDLGGRDTYSCGVSNGVPRLRPLYGVVWDVGVEP